MSASIERHEFENQLMYCRIFQYCRGSLPHCRIVVKKWLESETIIILLLYINYFNTVEAHQDTVELGKC